MDNDYSRWANPGCSDCGQYTTSRGPFGELLCSECWDIQDQAIEQFERKQPI